MSDRRFSHPAALSRQHAVLSLRRRPSLRRSAAPWHHPALRAEKGGAPC